MSKDESGRFYFDSLPAAAQGLKLLLEYARSSTDHFVFGPLTAQQILQSGLRVRGQTNKIRGILEDMPGASWYAD